MGQKSWGLTAIRLRSCWKNGECLNAKAGKSRLYQYDGEPKEEEGMGKIYSTGNKTTDRLAKMRITGNVIPQIWYKTIRKGTGKPNLNAIVILADIVYWYRPVEVRDEGSGAIVGYRKRFKGDLLQRSYQQIADQFGITKRDATNAVVELEKLGVVRRVFRTLNAEGISIPNVLFLELDADALERLTYPAEAEPEDAGKEPAFHMNVKEEKTNGKEKDGRQVPLECRRGITQIGDTPSSKRWGPPADFGEYTENTYKEYIRDYSLCSYQQVLEAFKEQIGYGQLCAEYPGDSRLDEVTAVAVEVLTSSSKTIRVNREDRPAPLVKAQFEKLTGEHVEYVLESLEQSGKPITNVRAVIITALYNAVNTLGCYVGNLYRYHAEQGRFGGGAKD